MSKKLATYDEALYWTVEDVGDWLQQVGFYEFIEPLQKYNINGKQLFELSESKLRKLYPNMPAGKSDPVLMLWRQINKVKENRRTGKKSKITFPGWGSEKKPPQAPKPDYRGTATERQASRNDQGSDDEGWDSDFSDDEENAEFDSTQGNTHGRVTSNTLSSTSSATNLSSSASGREDDSSMLYLAPNTDHVCGDFEQTYEVPSEQMSASYGECDEIYDIPHEEDVNSNSLHPNTPGRSQPTARSVSPLSSPRHEARPLPTLPPSQSPSHWQQQQQQRQQFEFQAWAGSRETPQTLPRSFPSPQHYPRQTDNAAEEEEQENYEVPTLEVEQPNYEAPNMEQEEELEEEEEYLVPVADGTSFQPQRPSNSPTIQPQRPFNHPAAKLRDVMSPGSRPPAPLPPDSSSGLPPPRPAKPPELKFTPVSASDEQPPPIPSRLPASRTPIESKGFPVVLPDPPPHVIREVVSKVEASRLERSPIRTPQQNHPISNTGENRNLFSRPPIPGTITSKQPPPLPKNIPREPETANQEKEENSGSGSGTIGKRLQQLQQLAKDPEPRRPVLAPRPNLNKPDLPRSNQNKPAVNKPPALASPAWVKPKPSDTDSKSSVDDRTTQPSTQSSTTIQQRPTPKPRLPPELPPAIDAKPTPPFPTKDPKIKKFMPLSHRGQPELPKAKHREEQPPVPAPEPQPQPQPVPRPMPQPPKQNEMTGFPWYDADLRREEAVQILKETKMDGAFVVRNSTKGGGEVPYSLSLWYNDKVRNLHIRLREDGKYALGTYKENEQVFDTAVLLIQYHMTNPLILAGDAGKTCLKVAAPNFR